MSITPQQRDARLEAQGWVLECESPLELRHAESGDFASGFAARVLLSELMAEEGKGPTPTGVAVVLIPEFRELFERIAFVVHLSKAAFEAKEEADWKQAFRTVFSPVCAGRIHVLLDSLNIPFPGTKSLSPRGCNSLVGVLNAVGLEHSGLEHWEDPENIFTWGEPATSYVSDLQEHAKSLQALQKRVVTALNLCT